MKKYFQHKTAEVEKGAEIGEGTKIWQNTIISKGAVVGKDCSIGHNCFIESKAELGNGVKLKSNIDVWDLVVLEDYVFVGPSVVFTNDKNPRAKYPKHGFLIPTTIKKGASIGANATILCGIIIGKWALIGAGAVVKDNISDYAVAVGNPAKVVGWVCECGNKLEFEENSAECRICKRKYDKKGDEVKQI